jgi:hypothetical protein
MLRKIFFSIGLTLSFAATTWSEGEPDLLDPHTTGSRLLLYRPGLLTYDNYGIEGYRPWPRNVLTRTANPVYDEFGQFLVNGVEVYRMEETRRFDDPVNPFSGSTVNKPGNYTNYMNRLMVADDSYNNWHTRFIIGDRIRTHFSPLVLDLAALNGIRWDVANEKHNFTLATSRLDRPIFDTRDAVLATNPFAAYLLGGHWRGRFNTFEVAASYVNLFRVDSRSPPKWDGMKGQLPNVNQIIDYMVVRIDDSSLLDGDGARVFDVEIILNGIPRPDIEPFITKHHREKYNLDFPNGDARFPRGVGSIPPYVEVLLGRQLGGDYPFIDPDAQEFLTADGKEYVLYWFPLPEFNNDGILRSVAEFDEEGNPVFIESISFEALVSGNYKISVAEIYNEDPRLDKKDPRQRNTATYFEEVAGSEGRRTAGSDIRRVRFDYGRDTGVTITGLELKTDVKGFRFKGEWAHSTNFLRFPGRQPLCDECPRGGRHDRGGDAWLLNAERELSTRTAIGGEWFRLDPEYNTTLTVTDLTLKQYTDPPGPFAGDLGTVRDALNFTLDLNSVDDNDDKDPFPDNFFLPSFSDLNGVFPGLDKDLDGQPDTNRNFNAVPDYFEPFLLYDVDPDDFSYGEDLDNNGVIDLREDDNVPDYPYDLNRQGYHVYLRDRPMSRLDLRVGRYDMTAIRGGMRSRSNYIVGDYTWEFPAVGDLRIVDFFKRVKDDIPDDVARYGDIANFDRLNPRGVIRVFVEDELLMKNSWVNTFFINGRFTALQNFFAEANFKFDYNRQVGGMGMDDDPNRIRLWTSVFRTDYTWRLSGLEIAPRYKFMFRKLTDDDGFVHQLGEWFSYPMVLVRYKFTEQSWFRAGIQGFPGLPANYRNVEDENQNYDTKDFLLMIINRFTYAGYDQVLTAGYQISQREMKDPGRDVLDINFEQFFIRMVVGLEPVL